MQYISTDYGTKPKAPWPFKETYYLLATNRHELLGFALALGLKPSDIREKPAGHCYVVLSPGQKTKALKKGATADPRFVKAFIEGYVLWPGPGLKRGHVSRATKNLRKRRAAKKGAKG